MFMLFLLAKLARSGCDESMTSQTRRRRICGFPALADGVNMQAIMAFTLGLSACGLAFCPSGPAFAAAPAAAAGPVAPQAASPAADSAIKPFVERIIETGVATWYGLRHSKHYTFS